MEIVKICKTHGELKISDVNSINAKARKSIQYRCKKCESDKRKKMYRENIEIRKKKNEYSAIWFKNNIKRAYEIASISRAKYREKYNLRQKKYERKMTANLSDTYIKKRLKTLKLPLEFLDVKREQIKLKRKLKELNSEKR